MHQAQISGLTAVGTSRHKFWELQTSGAEILMGLRFGVRVWGLGFRVWSLGFKVWGSGFGV